MAKTLLLADDSVTIQKVVSISFASEDVTLITVDNGDDAVIRAREARPDLILADVVMPGKSGYEVCEEIKSDPELRHIPVLLLSGTFEAFDEERAARAGAAGHVAKPFEAQRLVEQVNRLLAQTPPPRAAPVAAPAPAQAVAVPVETSAADSFDFFDDDLAELDMAIPAASDDEATPDLELSDDAFSLADDDFSPEPSQSIASPASPKSRAIAGKTQYPDRTVAILPDDPSTSGSAGVPPTAVSEPMLAGESELDAGELVALTDDDAEDSFMTADPASTADEAFDFSFESESTAPESLRSRAAAGGSVDAVALDELVEDAVLDPIGATGFDVDPLTGSDANEEGPVVELESSDEVGDATRVVGPGVGYEEMFAPAELEIAPQPPAPQAGPAAPLRPVSQNPMLGADSAARADAVLAEISPKLREAMHDTLEKIAWEAFGDVTEQIVREVVDRVEKVAWEVVPQLTETLIKAEIARLKSDGD